MNMFFYSDQKANGDPHYLSTEIVKQLQQQKHEIPMDLLEELPQPVPEKGANAAHLHQQGEPLSSLPSLMISQPHSLRSEPVEDTDYTNNHYHNNRQWKGLDKAALPPVHNMWSEYV